MAVKAKAEITLFMNKDTQSITRYYKSVPSGSQAPALPQNIASEGWVDHEPTCDISKVLYFFDCYQFTDGTHWYTTPSLSSTYTASVQAYNKAASVETTANSANNKIDNLAIGGRNYIKDSVPTDWFLSESDYPTITNRTSGCIEYLASTVTASNAYIWLYYVGHNAKHLASPQEVLNEGGTFTFSLDLKTEGFTPINNRLNISLYWRDDSNQTIYLTSIVPKQAYPDWVRLSCQVEIPKNTEVTCLLLAIQSYNNSGFTNQGAKIYYRNFKLEKGNKATDWTPAPEDVEANINTAQRTANTAQQTANDARKTATNYMNFDSNGLVIGDMTANTLGRNVLIDLYSVDVRDGSEILASFGENTIIGKDNARNVFLDSNAVNIRNGSEVLASFGENTIIGKDNARNVFLDSNAVNIRNGSEVLASFGDSDVHLGKNNRQAIIHLCDNAGTINVENKEGFNGGATSQALTISSENVVLKTSASESYYAQVWTDALTVDGDTFTSSVLIAQDDTHGAINARVSASTNSTAGGEVLLEVGGSGGDNQGRHIRLLSENDSVEFFKCAPLVPNNKSYRAYSNAYEVIPLLWVGTTNWGHVGGNSSTSVASLRFHIEGASLSYVTSTSSTYDAFFRPDSTGKTTLGTSDNRWYRLYQSYSSISTSDRRDKENIRPLGERTRVVEKPVRSLLKTATINSNSVEQDVYSELFDRLEPVEYNFIEGNRRTCFGLIAQDVIQAMADLGINEDELDLVYHDFYTDEETGEEKDTYGIAYENLIALLIYEIKKLKGEVKNGSVISSVI